VNTLLLIQAAPTGSTSILGLPLILIQLLGFGAVFYFLIRLAEQARAHILDGTFDCWSREWLRRHYARGAT
jgi:hypothetical protein